MSQFCLFSNGLELANLLVSSDLLQNSWAAIVGLDTPQTHPNDPTLPPSVSYKVSQDPINGTIIAFVTSPTCIGQHVQGEGKDLVSLAILRENFPDLFEFICTKVNPSFSINKAAVALFVSLGNQLSLLKDQFGNSNPLVITGHSLGGSVASLFTLWLLDKIPLTTPKRPICITFGSPLLGDSGFQRAILERPTWTSCFLHVASNQDPILKFFVSPYNALAAESISQTSAYKPFGTFLFCSDSGCACFDEPESILELMVAMSTESVGNEYPQINYYGEVLKKLTDKTLCRGISELGECVINPLWAGITLQLEAVGGIITHQQQNSDMNALISKFEKRQENFLISKKNLFDPTRKLNDRKINMTYLEWYKKVTRDQGGYYDSYKNTQSKSREEIRSKEKIVKHQRILTQYWGNMVKEVEGMPRKEGKSIRTRWLYAGTNYRRMVEPLDIAEYYSKGKRDYLSQGRSEHYRSLEQWLKEDKPNGQSNNATKRNKACSLTEDSCFWAHVEEAIISCRVLKDRESSPDNINSSRVNLIKFEQYVMDLISDYSLSPEVFLEQSSFMQWWREYEKIGTSVNSKLTEFMKNDYRKYA